MADPKPELFFGGVAPVGTPLDFPLKTLKNALDSYGYDVEPIKLSEQARLLKLNTPEAAGDAGEFARISALIERGNEARKTSGANDLLARLAVSLASEKRVARGSVNRGLAFVFRQLKHPEEAYLL